MTQVVATPVVECAPYLKAGDSEEAREACRRVARALGEYGQVIFHDPRVDFAIGEDFKSAMQAFFAKPRSVKEQCRMRHCSHQTGWTPPDAELPGAAKGKKDAIIATLEPGQRPLPVVGHDPKERYMFPIGPRLDAEVHGYHEFNAMPIVVPPEQPELLALARTWGESLRLGGMTILEMAAIGWGAEADSFTDRLRFGPHFLAPTGSDLVTYGKPGTVLAGFHNDMSFATVHGPATDPGLFAWTTGGVRHPVRLPRGHLILQCGRQMQWLTGGVAHRVFHEVAAVEESRARIEAAVAKGEPYWRVATPLFLHMNTNETAEPKGGFATPEAIAAFAPYVIGERLRHALKSRGLGAD